MSDPIESPTRNALELGYASALRASAAAEPSRCRLASDCDYPACWIEQDCAHQAWTGEGLPTAWRDEVS